MTKPTPPKAITPAPVANPEAVDERAPDGGNEAPQTDETPVAPVPAPAPVAPPVSASKKAPKEGKGELYVNPGRGLVDIKGAVFEPNKPRALTEDEAGNENITKRIQHALTTGLLQKA